MQIADLRAGARWVAVTVCLIALVFGPRTQFITGASAQETGSAADAAQQGSADEENESDTDKRLSAIEEAIKQLTAQIQAMKEAEVAQASEAPASQQSSGQSGRQSQSTTADAKGVEIDEATLEKMAWRSLGPSNMGGRVTDVEVHAQDRSLWWIATASGGILKTPNQGTTVEHQFDEEETVSIGAIASDPNNSSIVWVGTGEANPRNSVSYGNGVYKSTDGGASWEHVGLEKTYQVSRILVDPSDSNTVYVGAAGRLYGTSPERGVYKTTDGGETWEHVLSIDDRAGVIDMIMHPEDPQTIIAACWDRMRDGFDAWPGDVPRPDGIDGYDPIRKWGPGGGLYKTTDGGKNWTKLSNGLPPGMTGRIGLDWQTKGSQTIYAIIDCEDIGKGPAPFSAYLGLVGVNQDGKAVVSQVMPDSPAAKSELAVGDVLAQIDGNDVQDFDELLEALRSKKPGDKIALQLMRRRKKIDVEIELTGRPGSRPSNDAVMGINGENASGSGAKLTAVTEGGPGAVAGLALGDVVKKVGDKSIENYEALVAEIRSRQPGDKMKVSIVRAEQELDFVVTLGSRSESTTGDRPYTYSYFGQRPNVQDQQGADGYKYGGVYKSTDAGETWERVNSLNVRPMYFSVVRVDPNDDQRVYVLGVSQFQSSNGGLTFTSDLGRGVHADAHDMWINPDDGRHMIIGCDGGFYVTHDRGQNWDHINTAAVGQFYHATISDHKPYMVFGGLQDNGSWGGPGISRDRGAINSDWISVGGGDGFVCRTDREDPDLVYSESQNGRIGRRNLRTGERASIRPQPEEGLTYRFNWKTPFILSHHNPKLFYEAGNYVWRSLNRGDDLQRISPEITLTQRGSATALNESPLNPDVLYVGSDDGALWVTRDGGNVWKNITSNLPISRPMWVATIESSRFAEGRVYVCVDGHRSDSDDPHIFVSEDFGESFVSLQNNMTWGSTRCLREDPLNENLLYCGTEFAFWVSLDRGKHWTKFNQSLPSVAVHEVAYHADLTEIVLATHGRSLWACDVHALRQLSPSVMEAPSSLLPVASVTRWRFNPSRGRTNRRFVGTNPSGAATIWYTLAEPAETVAVQISNIEGEVLATLEGQTEAGLNRVSWTLSSRSQRGRFVSISSGTYKVTLVVNGEAQEGTQTVTVETDPGLSSDALSDEAFYLQEFQYDEEMEEEEEAEEGGEIIRD